jgi:hypothetical protein
MAETDKNICYALATTSDVSGGIRTFNTSLGYTDTCRCADSRLESDSNLVALREEWNSDAALGRARRVSG